MSYKSRPESVKISANSHNIKDKSKQYKKSRFWSFLTHNKLISVQSSNPEEGKGGPTSCWKEKHKGHQGVILNLFTKVTVDYLCCIPEQFHSAERSSCQMGSRTLCCPGATIYLVWGSAVSPPAPGSPQARQRARPACGRKNGCVGFCFKDGFYHSRPLQYMLQMWWPDTFCSKCVAACETEYFLLPNVQYAQDLYIWHLSIFLKKKVSDDN